jgi:hypothetical protein
MGPNCGEGLECNSQALIYKHKVPGLVYSDHVYFQNVCGI